MLKHFCLMAFLSLALVSCGEDGELQRKREEYSKYSLEYIAIFYEQGAYDKVLDIVQYYREQGKATADHFMLAARTYQARGDGIALEQTIYRLREMGTSEEETALLLSKAFLLQGKYGLAERALSGVELPAADVFDSLIVLGDTMNALGDEEQAGHFYQEAVQHSPDNPIGRSALALHVLKQGKGEEADQVFALVSPEAITGNAILSYTAGMINRYNGRIEAAQAHFERAIELSASDVLSRLELTAILMAANNREAAEQQLDAVYEIFPNNAVANYYSALMLANDGKYDEAEDLLLRSGSFIRNYPFAARAYGLTTYQIQKYSEAIPYLDRSLQILPNDSTVRLALADSLTRRGEASQALQVLTPLLNSNESADAYVYAMAAALTTGSFSQAQKYVDRAIAITSGQANPDQQTLADLERQAAAIRVGEKDIDGALDLYGQAYKRDNSAIEILADKANIYIANGDFKAAQDIVKQIKAQQPGAALAENLSGSIYHRQRQFDKAITAYSAALAIAPEYQSALKNRALAYTHKQDFVSARQDLMKLIKLVPGEPEVAALYGRALLETGDVGGAVKYLEQARQTLTSSPMVAGDYAEALAAAARFTDALNMGRRAKALANRNEQFVAYMDARMAEWEKAQAEAETLAAQAEETRTQEQAALRASSDALKEKLREENKDLLASREDPNKAINELRELAAELKDEKADAEREKQLQALKEDLKTAAVNEAPKDNPQRDARNRAFGAWVAEKLGLTGTEADTYVKSMMAEDGVEPGDTDLVRKALTDLEKAKVPLSIEAIQKKLAELEAETPSR